MKEHRQLINLRSMLHQLVIAAEVIAWAEDILYGHPEDVDDSFEVEYMRWSERWLQASSQLQSHLARCWSVEPGENVPLPNWHNLI